MGVLKGIYRCPCGYETKELGHMRRHLNKQKLCNFNKNRMLNVDDLFFGEKRITEDLSHLTVEEKHKRLLQQCLNNTTKYHMLGNMTIEQLAKKIIACMKDSTHRRDHEDVLWTKEDMVKILEDNKIYIISDTILGNLEFPMMLTNGYHNTVSFDRINNNIGYSKNNIEIRPRFLNTTYKLTTQDIKNLVEIREQKQNLQELINISKNINLVCNNSNFFYKLAKGAKEGCSRSKEKHKTFDFINIKECVLFLIKKFIEQGGRCAYSNIPIYPEASHKFKISPERIDPTKGYSSYNITLIVVGLNGPLSGQYLNKNLTEEERQVALEAGKFNQEYWDTCTKMTPDIRLRCEESRNFGCKILLENLNNKIQL